MERALNPGTRQWDIVVLVARRSPITVAEIAEEMGLARTSTQQQVGRLVAEGWLERASRHGKPGRPVDVFALSEQSRRQFARAAGGFAHDLLEEIAVTDGESKVRSLVKGIGRRMARKLGSRLGEGTLRERVNRLAELFSENGALNDVATSEQGFTLTIHTCPYHGLCKDLSAFCDMDREMVSRLVGAKARAKRRMADGHARCEFELANGAATQRKRNKE